MVAGQMLRARVGEAYVLVCTVLAAVAILPTEPPYLAFYGLVVFTLPVSLVAFSIQYLGLGLFFGPKDLDGVLARCAIFAFWVAVAIIQMVAVRVLLRVRARPSDGTS